MRQTHAPTGRRPATSALFAALLLASALPAAAATYTFAGQFALDDEVRLIGIDLAASGSLSAFTTSYAAGGFDTVLSLFASDGTQLDLNNDGGCGSVGQDPVTHSCWDARLDVGTLAAGHYTLALTQSDNTPLGPLLSDGFSRAGQGNFTGPSFLGAPGAFLDANLTQRTSHWSVTVTGASLVPEPAAATLWLIGLLSAAALPRRRGAASRPRPAGASTTA